MTYAHDALRLALEDFREAESWMMRQFDEAEAQEFSKLSLHVAIAAVVPLSRAFHALAEAATAAMNGAT